MKTTKYFIGLLMAFAWMGCSKEDDNKEDIKLSVSDEIFYANHFAKAIEQLCRASQVNIIGGCCGTTPEYIAQLKRVAERWRPKRV